VDPNAFDPDEEPEEPPNKQAAKNSAAAAAAAGAGKKAAGGKASSSSSSSSGTDDDYYPIDSEDAAVASTNEDASSYEGLDPEEMPIEPPPPAPPGSKAAGTSASTTAAAAADSDAGAGGAGGDADGAQWVEFYDNAPTCAGVPTISNSVYDGSGRLWVSVCILPLFVCLPSLLGLPAKRFLVGRHTANINVPPPSPDSPLATLPCAALWCGVVCCAGLGEEGDVCVQGHLSTVGPSDLEGSQGLLWCANCRQQCLRRERQAVGLAGLC
jgi:hypothetical protein